MMNNKEISISQIVELMIQGTDISRDKAEEYIRVLLSSIEDALIEGETVKIKGLGNFRTLWNDQSNQLVDEKGIIISGFYQVVFTPQDFFKDEINEPFAHLESVKVKIKENESTSSNSEQIVEPDEPFRLFEEQASEIKDLLKEINELSERTEKKIKDIKREDKSEEDEGDFTKNLKTLDNDVRKSSYNEKLTPQLVENKDIKAQEFALKDFSITRKIYEDYPEANKKKSQKQPSELKNNEQKTKTERINTPSIKDTEKNKPELFSYAEGTNEVKINSSSENNKADSQENNEIQITSSYLPNRKIDKNQNSEKLKNEIYDDKLSDKQSKKSHRLLYILIALFTIVIIAALVYFFTLTKKNKQINKEKERIERIVDSVAHKKRIKELQDSIIRLNRQVNNELEDETSDELISTQNSLDENKENSDLAESTSIDIFNEPRTYNKFIGKEKMTVGSKLTTFARNYYGHANFWVYIYEANRDKISNPDNVPAGIELNIPEIDSRLIDTKNPQTINYAKELQRKYLNH